MNTKAELRRAFKARGAALTSEYRAAADRAIRDAVLQSEVWRRAERVFLYVSMWAEPDTRALIDAALEAGKSVYVPLCCPDNTMMAVRIRSFDALRPGMRGIPEPPADGEAAEPGTLELAVVPCVTAAKDGARLGHGAGYYDRFLNGHACQTMCLCYGQMLAHALPMDEHDVWMDFIVTESGITAHSPGS